MRRMVKMAMMAVMLLATREAAAATCTPSNFLADPSCTLYDQKVAKNPLPPGESPTHYPMAVDLNNIAGAAYASRNLLLTHDAQILTAQGQIQSMQAQLTALLAGGAAATCSAVDPVSGLVGTLIWLTGTNLAGATAVTVNGVNANHAIVSSTLVNAIVPVDATTGLVKVYTPATPAGVSCGTFTVSTTSGSITSVAVPSQSVQVSQAVQMTANVTYTGTISTAVTWSMQAGSPGSVSSSGVYTAPASAGTATVIATSVADPSKSGSGIVTITAAPSGNTYYVAHGGSNSWPGTQAQPWGTLAYAMQQLRPGYTLYVRGGPAGSDDNTACTAEGGKNGACWRETQTITGNGTHSPVSWARSDGHYAGTTGNPVTVACYPGDVCILEPASGDTVVSMEAQSGSGQTDAAHCSYVTLDGLIIDARSVSGRGVWIQPKTGNTDPSNTMCAYVTIKNSKIRHGKWTSGMEMYTFHGLFQNNEVYENGADDGVGDHDHGIYTQGQYNVFSGGRWHHNIQGLQIENTSSTEAGYVQIDSVEVDHNGYNPWNAKTRNGANGDIMILLAQGSGTSAQHARVTNNRVHDNTHIGITAGAVFGEAVSYVDITGNKTWANGDQSSYSCGPSIFTHASDTNITCSNNTTGP